MSYGTASGGGDLNTFSRRTYKNSAASFDEAADQPRTGDPVNLGCCA